MKVIGQIEELLQKALSSLEFYEFATYLVGIELPVKVEEREDEFKANFNINYAESMKHEFGRLSEKLLALGLVKEAEYLIPEIVVVINPFLPKIRLQVNPLSVADTANLSAQFLSQNGSAQTAEVKAARNAAAQEQLYPESVEEYTSKPILEASQGEDSFFLWDRKT
ncbi:MAG: hypothetical protein MZU95_12705 [Desulfomicrobium escambiense]|nr:hypothetical protein [Desulfomicrobium escambiense]